MTLTDWRNGSPSQLIADLRPGGWVMGHSAKWPRLLRLHKTDLISDLRKRPDSDVITWRIKGEPEQNGRYAGNRRTIVVWLGQ